MRARTGWVACAALVAAVAWTSAIGQEPALSWPAPADGMADEEVLERALPMVQDEEQRGRRARIAALRDSLDPLLRANRGDALLRNLDEIAELQEEDGLSADLVEQTRATRDEMALRWAAVLAARGRREDALEVLRQAPPSARREEALAHALYALHRYDDAFAALDDMIRFDARRATRLRGSFYLQLGAVPLAVETFRPLGGDPEVAGILLSLQQKGLHRFQRSERLGWTVFEADAGSLPARTIAYWYPNRGGRLAAHLGVELAMRPAPRPFTLPLVLQSLLRLRWPWVQQPREYELVLWGDGAQQVVALWDWEPREDEITDAARRARVAFQPLREAEALLQAGRRDEALAIALAQSAAPRWWFTPRPHLTALSLGVRAAAEQGDRALAERLALRIGDWHPMWGALVLARAWEAAGWADRARAAYDQALAVAPQRGEPLLQRARFEWAVALADRSSERPAAWLRAQKAARRLQELRPAEGLWLRARIAFELDGHALAGVLLRQLALTPGAPDGAFEMQALLESLAQWDFARAGEPVALGNGLALHGWRSRERPPEDPALKHHGAELLVVDADGDLVETFTLTSQRAVAQGARQYTVDRVTAHGTRQLRAYGNRPPSFERLLQELSATLEAQGAQPVRTAAEAEPPPAPLPAPAVARELAPQALAGAAGLARAIDHEQALEALRRRERRLADSSWLQERQELQRAEAERQLPQVQTRLQETLTLLPPEPRYRVLRDTLLRSAQALAPEASPRRQGMY